MHGRQDGVEVARLLTPTEPGTALATEAPGVLMRGHTPGCVRKGGLSDPQRGGHATSAHAPLPELTLRSLLAAPDWCPSASSHFPELRLQIAEYDGGGHRDSL